MNPISPTFQAELETLEKTYQWALQEAPVDTLVAFCQQSAQTPLLSVGSGGSLTIAAFAALMHQTQGMVAKAITPLEFFSMGPCIPQASVLFPSAGGKNTDVMQACEFAISHAAQSMLAVCGGMKTPLAEMTRQHGHGSALEFTIPTGRDGFLATVSLIAFCTILMKGYNQAYGSPWCLAPVAGFLDSAKALLARDLQPLFQQKTWLILYGGWGLPVAMDAESKLTESTLMSSRLADYRNFTHGHYHWLVQNPETTGVIALITPAEKDLAEQTLRHLPPSVATLRLETEAAGPPGTVDLMLQLICLVQALGESKSWDPVTMAVPEFCKSLQSLSYQIPSLSIQGSLSQ